MKKKIIFLQHAVFFILLYTRNQQIVSYLGNKQQVNSKFLFLNESGFKHEILSSNCELKKAKQ